MKTFLKGLILAGLLASTASAAFAAQSLSQGSQSARIIFKQLGGDKGTLYLTHKKYSSTHTNYKIKSGQNRYHSFKIGAVCANGHSLKQIDYRFEGEQVNQVAYMNYQDGAPKSHTTTVKTTVFTDTILKNKVRNAMGGGWYGAFPKAERKKSKTVTLKRKIRITRYCVPAGGGLIKKSKNYFIKVKPLKIVDLDY